MKTLNESFTDEEFAVILKAKGTRTWHDFLLNVSIIINASKEVKE